jgi:hypothetical protein
MIIVLQSKRHGAREKKIQWLMMDGAAVGIHQQALCQEGRSEQRERRRETRAKKAERVQ